LLASEKDELNFKMNKKTLLY